jgi:uncharacterized damage-inducible protein DinB
MIANDGMNDKDRLRLEALAGTPRDLFRLTKKVDDAGALVRPAPHDWCIKDVIAHLWDCEGQYLARLQTMVVESNPIVQPFGPNVARHDLSQSTIFLIDAFAQARAAMVDYLSSLTHEQWLRTCRHPELGEIKVRQQVDLVIGHDNEHLAQIVTIREFIERQ